MKEFVLKLLKDYCETYDDVNQLYGYVQALVDIGVMSEVEATKFLDLFVWYEDTGAAWKYLEECVG